MVKGSCVNLITYCVDDVKDNDNITIMLYNNRSMTIKIHNYLKVVQQLHDHDFV